MPKDLNRLTVTEFLEELASAQPAPGGGTVAALAGALAAALTTMVARLTLGKKKFQDRHALMATIEQRAEKRLATFQVLLQQDTQAYQAVVESFRRPKNTDEEKAQRAAAVEKALQEAARIPLETLARLDELMDDAAHVLRSGNPNAASDAGAAVQLIRAAAFVAAYNVWINLKSLRDETFRKDAEKKVRAALERIETRAARGHDDLRSALEPSS
ncbi:cyclodeaminase/cyclohydrolase family protein [Desulfosoma caldarium]|uniref:Formimidoyltetrahydrofolate cyclodeaminase n=1 Tax=Desulfosoma caldarium TaxID=610254 RepID=A0A3N1UKH5_9BACT|nr:cyclodeaminase/cyclohydrolase family protein [Desulfosoma caldarium]ROQ90228.1 formimidoyltetrahydrofolate cyclodeaminase [Desulfosoma caldarium]